MSGNIDELKKLSFWVSHIFILLATVIGVFLAANQGYQQAVQFENTTSYKNNFYLQKSLQYELQDNVAILKNYINKIHNGEYSARQEPLKFYTLVWDNMKFSNTTLGTPPEYLRQAQQFYREVEQLHDKIANNTISVPFGIQKLNGLVTTLENELIPGLEKSTAQIKTILDKTDVIL